ncbi:DUF4302 domain-containing protein [Niabella sp. 22666]|uniref:DUF4302 domain-containing protein n=1 Tax=Niabella sp. 22666 TaxID=3453954 RepID=UPI003F8390CB
MEKRIVYLFLGALLIIFFNSCEKNNIAISLDEAKQRNIELVKTLKENLHSSERGWVMMVSSTLSKDVASPVVLKFDTLQNRVGITSTYGITDSVPTFFEISSGTGSPLLTFSTGSIISSFFRIGALASDITDHIFKVISVSSDTIKIQPYRSGRVYSKEGGVVYSLFKRPADWTWADAKRYFDMSSSEGRLDLSGRPGDLTLKYKTGAPELKLRTTLNYYSDAQVIAFSTPIARDPFVGNISAKGFKTMYPFYVGYYELAPNFTNTTLIVTIPMLGHNAISFYPFTYNANTNANVIALATKLKTHYLIAKSVEKNASGFKVDFVAYDKRGNEVVNAVFTAN